jgi:hypothetical protein
MYVLSAGPLAYVIESDSKLYARIYDPLCAVNNRLPSPLADWYCSYTQAFEPEREMQGCSLSPTTISHRSIGHIQLSYWSFLVRTETERLKSGKTGAQTKPASQLVPPESKESP